MGKRLFCAVVVAVILVCGVTAVQGASSSAPAAKAAPAPSAPPAKETSSAPSAKGAPSAPSAEELAKRLADTQAQLENANRRLGELERKFGELQGTLGETSKGVDTLEAQLKKIEVKGGAMTTAGGFTFTPYGYIKVDMVYDDTRTSGTSATAFVLPEKPGYGSDRHYTITARQTRLGVNIGGPDIGNGKSSGKIEVDFYAPATVENKAQLMLRQAYWKLAYPNWNVLVGQAWEVVSPSFPHVLNYSYLALSGNPGYRKPMIRYERTDKVLGDKKLKTDVALVRGIGTATGLRSTSWLDDEASDAGVPDIEARVGISIPTKHKRPIVVGVSGHYGREEYDYNAASVFTTGSGTLYTTYSGNIDWAVPLGKNADFTGEFFSGRNLDGYMGGIGQGVNLKLGKAIDAIGGWGQLCYHPEGQWVFSVGAGIDDPQNSDLSAGGRTRNATYFTNAIYNISKSTLLGLEVSYQDTDWKGTANGDNIRVQTSLQFKF